MNSTSHAPALKSPQKSSLIDALLKSTKTQDLIWTAERASKINAIDALPVEVAHRATAASNAILNEPPISKEQALVLAATLVDVIPSQTAKDDKKRVVVLFLAEALERYPAEIAKACVSLDGLIGSERWLPAPATVIAWCESTMSRIRDIKAAADTVARRADQIKAEARERTEREEREMAQAKEGGFSSVAEMRAANAAKVMAGFRAALSQAVEGTKP